MGSKTKREERFINPDLRRSFRKTYNPNEAKWGALVVFGLVGVLAWVLWRGAHPDPSLFGQGPDLLVNSGSPMERGVLPKPLAPEGWSEASISRFGPDNLYEKINGREGFYKGFGFRELTFASLVANEDPTMAIDIELYDLGTPVNAVGCYAAERQPDAKTVLTEGGLQHRARNGLFMTRGKYYARAIAPDESERSLSALAGLQETLSELPAAPLPWGYEAFALEPTVDSSTIEAFQRDAFSFSFAQNVFAAKIGKGETTVFLSPADDPEEHAKEYQAGFASLGEVVEGEIPWVKDRYLGELSGATTEGPWVIGVRAAPDVSAADEALTLIRRIARAASEDLRQRARASRASGGGEYDDAETESAQESRAPSAAVGLDGFDDSAAADDPEETYDTEPGVEEEY